MIKYPGVEIAFYSILSILVGTFVAFAAFAQGKTWLGIAITMLPVGCVLIWLDIRPGKWLVVAFFGIAAIVAAGMIFANGFTWGLVTRGCIAAYIAFLFAVWNGKPNAE